MAIDNITPIASSVLLSGDSVSFMVDDTYTVMQVEVQIAGPAWEDAYNGASGGAQAGYTVSVTAAAGRHTFVITRDTGWNLEPQLIRVTEDEADPGGATTETTTSYFLGTNRLFPQGSEPLNPLYVGTLIITEDNVQIRDDVGWLDFDGATFNLTNMGNGKVLVTGVAAGSDLAVEDEGSPLTAACTKFNFVGPVVAATEPVADEILVAVLGTSLEGAINNATPDNDINVPSGSPLILRDAATNFTVLELIKTGNSSTTDFVKFTTDQSQSQRMLFVNYTTTGHGLVLRPDGIGFAPDQVSYTVSVEDSTAGNAGGNLSLRAGDAVDASDGGDVFIRSGASVGGTHGHIDIGHSASSTHVQFGVSTFIKEIAAAATDIASYGQIWVKNTTPNELWYTDDAGTDVQLGLAASAGTLDATLTGGTPDSDVNVPAADPIILRDNAANFELMKLVKTGTTATTDFFTLECSSSAYQRMLVVTHSAGNHEIVIKPGAITMAGDVVTYTIGPDDSTAGNQGANVGIIAGASVDASDGGDVYIRSGASASGTPGKITFGFSTDTSRVSSEIPFHIKETAAAIADVAGYGQLWVDSGDGHLNFTGDDGVDHDIISGLSGGGGIAPGWGNWAFDTGTTDVDPGTGEMAYGNAALTADASWYIDDINDAGVNFDLAAQSVFATVPVVGDFLRITLNTDDDISYLYEITGTPVDGTGYWKLPCEYVDKGIGAGVPGAADLLSVVHIPAAVAATGFADAPDAALFTERADHVNAPAATKGELWVQNDAHQTLMFTDDAGNDRRQVYSYEADGQTNTTLAKWTTEKGRLLEAADLRYTGAALQLLGTDYSLQIKERAAAPTGTASYGHLWVKNDAPSTPQFTDDSDVTYQLGRSFVNVNFGGRWTGGSTGTWYGSPVHGIWDAATSYLTSYGTGADPAVAAATACPLVAGDGFIRSIITNYQHSGTTVDGKISLYKIATVHDTATSTETLCGSDVTITAASVAWEAMHDYQTDLSVAVAQGDMLRPFVLHTTTTATLVLSMTVLLELS